MRISDTSKYMEIKSPAFKHNGAIPKTYTCDGENINPPLEISGIPKGTKSLALIVDDPDAPSGALGALDSLEYTGDKQYYRFQGSHWRRRRKA